MTHAISFRLLRILICSSFLFLFSILVLGQAESAVPERHPRGGRNNSVPEAAEGPVPPAIVIGFVGGVIRHDDPVHSEVQLAARLRKAYPSGVDIETFESYHGENARKKIISMLDTNRDGNLTP